MPGRARNTPAGSNRRRAGISTATAIPDTAVASMVMRWDAQLNADTPAAAARAAVTDPGVGGAGSCCSGSSCRTAGTTRLTASTTTGTKPRNTQCHDSASVTTPAAGGPISDGSTHAEASSPNTAGRGRPRENAGGKEDENTGTGPMSSCAMLPAVPATSRPIPNSNGEATNGTLGPTRSDQRPPSTVPNTAAAMNDTNGQAYSGIAPRSATSAGIADPTPIASNAIRLINSTSPVVVARRLGPNSSERMAGGVGTAVTSPRMQPQPSLRAKPRGAST